MLGQMATNQGKLAVGRMPLAVRHSDLGEGVGRVLLMLTYLCVLCCKLIHAG